MMKHTCIAKAPMMHFYDSGFAQSIFASKTQTTSFFQADGPEKPTIVVRIVRHQIMETVIKIQSKFSTGNKCVIMHWIYYCYVPVWIYYCYVPVCGYRKQMYN